MKWPFRPLSGRPRRCEECDAPVIVQPDGTILDDRAGRRDQPHIHHPRRKAS